MRAPDTRADTVRAPDSGVNTVRAPDPRADNVRAPDPRADTVRAPDSGVNIVVHYPEISGGISVRTASTCFTGLYSPPIIAVYTSDRHVSMHNGYVYVHLTY